MTRRELCGVLFATAKGELVTCTRPPGHLTGMHRDGSKVPAPPREVEAVEAPSATCKIRYEQRGGHVHAQVFVGHRHALAKAGDLVFRVEEWRFFEAALELGAAQTMGHFVLIAEGTLNKEGD